MAGNNGGRTVYQEITREINHETGEVKITNDRQVVKKNSTPDFVMLFTQTAPMLANANLTSSQSTTLFAIISKFVGKNNLLNLSAATKELISRECDLKYNTVDQNIRTLIKKNIILRDKIGERGYQYYLNPYVFGKGNWADIEQLRYTVDIQYDFKNLEYSRQETTSIANGLSELNDGNHYIEERKNYIDEAGTAHEDVIVASKENIIDAEVADEQPKIESISDTPEIPLHKNQMSLELDKQEKQSSISEKLEKLANIDGDKLDKLLLLVDRL